MKAGVRPFGCALIVAYCDGGGDSQVYQLDPSGAVQRMEEGIGMIGEEGSLVNQQDISKLMRNPELKMSQENVTHEIVSAMKREAEMVDATNFGKKSLEKSMSFLVATLSFDGRLQLDVLE
eukprot:CAMPEP_0116009234 /NCGR_PEP_ID=MMETSP0321-20121206/3316_1 /TAXON_ID=163516 /ORGANISM="Leptocylindrus danicus var. danicus, Strain B650" /LENGTH=120 /DNA_ID=CAMNT_0003478167 /DNA_START=41 /DNA_END=403 /DNA_ORIENTATION=+